MYSLVFTENGESIVKDSQERWEHIELMMFVTLVKGIKGVKDSVSPDDLQRFKAACATMWILNLYEFSKIDSTVQKLFGEIGVQVTFDGSKRVYTIKGAEPSDLVITIERI